MTAILLDNALAGSALLLDAPERIIAAQDPSGVPAALEAMEEALRHGKTLAGFFSYELGYLMDARTAPLLPAARTLPLLWFAVSQNPRPLDAATVTEWLAARTRGKTCTLTPARPAWDAAAYTARASRVLDAIASGEVYQINLTFPLRFECAGAPAALYAGLRQNQPVACGTYIETPAFSVLSVSPELFFETDGNTITVKPMKGTAPRGPYPSADAQNAATLATDPKQKAENLMIVDLMRNDLGRIAQTGSVRVDSLFGVETYPSLHQMVSRVSARQKTGTTLRQMLEALFPAGSITGAPKIRAMELIRELEDTPRGVYCGAIGVLHPNGAARFSVAIRTLACMPDGTCSMGVGSGVVADSDTASEYAECLLKSRFLTQQPPAFGLIESMRWSPDEGHVLLARHLARLEASARYFGFACDIAALERQLIARAATYTQSPCLVRLVLARDGTVTLENRPLPAGDAAAPMRYRLADTAMDSRDVRLYHKTTDRAFYDDAHKAATTGGDCDELVFFNERGELTEGSRTNIFIARGNTLLTPPVSSGLLAGTLRAELLANGRAQEAVLTLQDLESAQKVYLGNGVRGLREGLRVR